jgi:tRNA threonylcarbamoyl adenosine modification protein YeaZ
MLLCMDPALAGLSVALCDGDRIVAEHHVLIGRGHAESVIPVVADVMARAGVAAPDRIVVDIGPGSFTGLRIGIAAARGLGLAWGVPVDGMRATDLVAAAAFAGAPDCERLAVVLDAGRGQLYIQRFGRDRPDADDEIVALSPEDATHYCAGLAVAGPGASLLGNARLLSDAWPRAADARLLAPAARTLTPAPLYVRAPDAVAPGAGFAARQP